MSGSSTIGAAPGNTIYSQPNDTETGVVRPEEQQLGASRSGLSAAAGLPATASTPRTLTPVPVTTPANAADTRTAKETASEGSTANAKAEASVGGLSAEESDSVLAMMTALFADRVEGKEGVAGVGAVDKEGALKADVTGTVTALGPVAPPAVELGPEQIEGAQVTCDMLNQALSEPFFTADGQLKTLGQMSSDDLIAAFLKLNINDPNISPETQAFLLEITKKLRQTAIANEKTKTFEQAEKLKEALEEKKSASGYASMMQVIQIVIIIISLIAAIFTCGAALAAVGVVQVATQAMIQMVMKIIMMVIAIVSAGVQVGNAKAQHNATMAGVAAQEVGIKAKKHGMIAEQLNEEIMDRQEIVKLLLESKSKIIDAVLKMLNASAAAKNLVISSSAAR